MTCDEFIELHMKMQKRWQERIEKEKVRMLATLAEFQTTLQESLIQESLIVDKAFATFSKEDQEIISWRLKELAQFETTDKENLNVAEAFATFSKEN